MRFSKIDDNLSIYKEKKVIIWGISGSGMRIYKLLQSYDIKVYAFCDNDSQKCGSSIDGIKVLSSKDIVNLNKENILVQIASIYEEEIEKQLADIGVKEYILYSEAKYRLELLKKYQLFSNNENLFEYYRKKFYHYEVPDIELVIWQNYLTTLSDKKNSCIILCMPPKTGDNTIQDSLLTERIPYINLIHSTYYMTDELKKMIGNKKIKIVVGVRDVISQNLSILYQYTTGEIFWNKKEYWKNGGDVQKLFDEYIKEEMLYYEGKPISNPLHHTYKQITQINGLIQNFFEYEFEKRWGINLYEYPFDAKKGYSIIQIGNLEILVYQLEKLNTNYKEILKFLGMVNPKLVIGNDSKSKWYYPYYKEAKEKIRFSKEYFNNCYNTAYMNHFYSYSDINKFKKKWEKQIV